MDEPTHRTAVGGRWTVAVLVLAINAAYLAYFASFEHLLGGGETGQRIPVWLFGAAMVALSLAPLVAILPTSAQARAPIPAAIGPSEPQPRIDEEHLRQALRAARLGIWDHDHVGDSLYVSEEFRTIFGFGPDRPVTMAEIAAHRHPEDAERVAAAEAEASNPQGEGTLDIEHRIVLADARVRWLRLRSQTTFERTGAVPRQLRTVGGVVDITEQKAAEERLQQQASLLDQAQDAITIRGLDGIVRFWNGGAERIYGFSAAETLGTSVTQLLGHDEVLAQQIRERLLAEGEHTAIVPERRKDGRLLQMEGRYKLMRDRDGRPSGFFAIKTDVTRRLELEAQLLQAQRLEAIGQLTGGVAHDFNNLLTVILGNADLLSEFLADDPRLLPLAEMTRAAAQRGAELTHGLLAFARKQALQPLAVNANQLLAGIEPLLRRTLPEHIEFERVHGAGLWPCSVDPAQLESALLNLVLNARDAMPDGGKITVEAANAAIDQEYVERHAEVKAGQYVMLSLSDTGFGMSPEQLSRAFEPFYTTKGVGKGTGLGLSMVYGFVKQSRGHIKLYSEPGQGTTVRLYLPRADADADAEIPAPSSPTEKDYAGSGIVLVVEDDEMVRRFAQDVLRRQGYTVLAAEHGPGALGLIRQRADIDLMFTDVIMPGGLNGRQLADEAVTLRPALKVLFTSGYTENAIVHHGRLDRGVQLLPKPYRAVDLARKVWSMMNGN